MNRNTIEIYDPPQSCATGACSAEAADAAAQFDASLERLAADGMVVARYNLGLDPEAFAVNPLIKGALREGGLSVLPLVVVGGEILCRGGYPSIDELAARLGFRIPSN